MKSFKVAIKMISDKISDTFSDKLPSFRTFWSLPVTLLGPKRLSSSRKAPAPLFDIIPIAEVNSIHFVGLIVKRIASGFNQRGRIQPL